MESNANYVVVEKTEKNVINFYSTKLPQSLSWAKECSRHMKSITGKEYEVLIRIETKDNLLTLKEYEHTLDRETN